MSDKKQMVSAVVVSPNFIFNKKELEVNEKVSLPKSAFDALKVTGKVVLESEFKKMHGNVASAVDEIKKEATDIISGKDDEIAKLKEQLAAATKK